ncbi:MAG: hypothetical protein ACOZNI_28240 [Myxococcota bacterium]
MPRWLLPLQSLALAVLLTWPAAATLTTQAVGSVEGDGVKHVWTLWWMRHELLAGEPGLRTALVNFPTGMDLWPIEPLHAPFALLPLSPVALSNLLAVANVALVGTCVGWLGRLVSERDAGALVAGALAQASSFVAFTLHVGVGELREVWWIPLGLGCLVRARQTLAGKWFLALAAALAGATLSCFYHGFFLATAVSLYALATLRPWPRLLIGYAVAAALAIAVVVPVIRGFSTSYAPADERPRTPFLQYMGEPFSIEPYRAAAMDGAQLLGPRAGERATADRQTLAYTGGRYLGWGTLALALAGLLAAPRRALPWLVVAGGGVVLSLGTVLWWGGALVEPRVVLPLAYLNRALAWVAEPMNFPARFVAVTAIALPVMASLATRWRVVPWLVPVAMADMVANDLVPWPRATFALPDAGDLVAPEGAVADLTPIVRARGAPADGGGRQGASILSNIDPESRTRGIAAQIATDRPFQTVPLERADHWAADGLLWTSALPLARAIVGEPVGADEIAASAWLLRDRGFGAVLVTHGCGAGPDPAAAAVLDGLGERTRATCATLWPVPEVPPGDTAAWARDQEARAAALAPPRMGPQFPR